MGVVRPVPQADGVDRVQPRRARAEVDGVEGRGDGGYDGVARVPQRLATFLVLQFLPMLEPSTYLTDTRDRRSLGRLWRLDASPRRPVARVSLGWKHHSPSTALSSSRRRVARHDGDRIVRLPSFRPFRHGADGTDVCDACSRSRSQRSHRRRSQTEVRPRFGTADARPSPRERDVERRSRDRAKATSGDGGTAHRHYQRRNRLLAGYDRMP
jgi:hypothetical protein